MPIREPLKQTPTMPATVIATRIHLCRPRDPEAKGLVERANGDLETSFLPGRTVTGPEDFNTQPTAWPAIANRRQHRTMGARPIDRWDAAGPRRSPCRRWTRHAGGVSTRIGRDHCIRVDT